MGRRPEVSIGLEVVCTPGGTFLLTACHEHTPPPSRRYCPPSGSIVSADLPWLIMPLGLALMMAADPNPFGPGASHPMASKRK